MAAGCSQRHPHRWKLQWRTHQDKHLNDLQCPRFGHERDFGGRACGLPGVRKRHHDFRSEYLQRHASRRQCDSRRAMGLCHHRSRHLHHQGESNDHHTCHRIRHLHLKVPFRHSACGWCGAVFERWRVGAYRRGQKLGASLCECLAQLTGDVDQSGALLHRRY